MPLKNRPVTLATALLALASTTGCGEEPQPPDTSKYVDFTVQILHTSDQESGLDATEAAPRFSAVLRKLEQEFPRRTLKLASGDQWLPGVFFNAGGDPAMSAVPQVGRASAGRADIAIVNEMGFHAASFGNHEFDSGTREVRNILAADRQWPGAKFPYLSANLDFSGNSDLSSLVTESGQVIDAANPGTELHNKITASVVFDVDGRKVGVVGATTPQLPRISSPGSVVVRPADPVDYDALAAELQPHVDALRSAGIDKIILMAHMQQYDIEVDELPRRLDGVDIIIAGGNHSVWADVDDVLHSGDTRVAEYPQWQTSKVGEPVAVLNVAANWRYVGRFLAKFDSSGRLVREKYDPIWNGAYATDAAGVQRVGASAMVDPEVKAIATAVKDVVRSKDGNVVGRTQVYLNGLRASVRTEETNFGNLTGDANLWYARQTDASTVISLKNGGGIRDSIGTVGTGATPTYGPPAANPDAEKPEGGISQLDIENSLRFNNDLVLLTVTAEQLEQVLEHAVAGVALGATPGQFPQVAGVRFEYDASRTAQELDGEGKGTVTVVGERIRKAEVVDDAGNVVDTLVLDGVLQGDPTRTFRLVTLGFLARRNGDTVDVGGDNYPFPRFETENPTLFDLVSLDGTEGKQGFSDAGREQRALTDYLSAMYPISGEGYAEADTAKDADTRIKRLD